MSFKIEKIDEFKSLFLEHKDRIQSFEGCHSVCLLQDLKDHCTFFTYSIWDSEHHLELYRQSELFFSVWSKTKVLFLHKPQAWSVKEIS